MSSEQQSTNTNTNTSTNTSSSQGGGDLLTSLLPSTMRASDQSVQNAASNLGINATDPTKKFGLSGLAPGGGATRTGDNNTKSEK
ncbi:hypothetical protein I302_105196 [Kwoniella bestiolae CBS 10118]|uniref:Uncharacterized protein n=1 Tax=Kwoniella bestiolae CBS 10118 TaxID=1296100 RepID=A0A1B9FSF6_9TREE|nr:hypothetical protein I302_08484 [Kwoniella bestiolae CBS 10118]OCF21707.1 hypothetical protein I302_08484 [Kwoniella bestiolae CBS 10118]